MCVGNCLEFILENSVKKGLIMWYRRSDCREKGGFMEEVGSGWLPVEDGAFQAEGTAPGEGTDTTGTQSCFNLAKP